MPGHRDKRQSRRITSLKPTHIILKGQRLRVSDISNDGIGIILNDDAPPFSVGERLAQIPLPLEGGDTTVEGIVSHISLTTAGKTCGIRFIFSGTEYDAVMRFISERMRTRATQEKS